MTKPKPMRLLLLVLPLALVLTGCGRSLNIAQPSKPPHPPKEALEPCQVATLLNQALSSADVYGLIKRQDEAIFQCEAKRRLLVDSWPK
jgi:hypothetical protein